MGDIGEIRAALASGNDTFEYVAGLIQTAVADVEQSRDSLLYALDGTRQDVRDEFGMACSSAMDDFENGVMKLRSAIEAVENYQAGL